MIVRADISITVEEPIVDFITFVQCKFLFFGLLFRFFLDRLKKKGTEEIERCSYV